jgi:glycosyltransferase involved in cell wall biosynthesis
VTVVVMTRNRREGLLRTISALLALPEQPSVIVVDNGSSDGSPNAVSERFPSVELVRLPRNAGACARNVGVRHATTPYVAFADDDSWWAFGALSRAAELLKAHPTIGVVVARTLVGPEERPDPIEPLLAESPLGVRDELPGPSVLGFLAFAAVVRRSAFLAAGGFSPTLFFLGEESLLAWDLASLGYQLVYCHDVVAHHYPTRPDAIRAAARRRQQQRNRLVTTWLRRPAPVAIGQTATLARGALRNADSRGALRDVLLCLPRIVRDRHRLPRHVERDLQLLERESAVVGQLSRR